MLWEIYKARFRYLCNVKLILLINLSVLKQTNYQHVSYCDTLIYNYLIINIFVFI